jgi:ankyrin repeat protein
MQKLKGLLMGKSKFILGGVVLAFYSIMMCYSAIAAPCKGLCSPDWWENASEEKVQKEMNSASYLEDLRQDEWKCSCEHFLVDETRGLSWRRSPMHVISFTNNLGDMTHAEAINILLEYELDLEIGDAVRKTPLHTAAQYGNPKTIKAFVKAGANLEAEDSGGAKPIHGAVKNSSDNVMALLEAGAEVKARDNKGHTALHFAAAYYPNDRWMPSLIENIDLLIEEGLKLTDRAGETGYTVLHMAALAGRSEVLEHIIQNDKRLDMNARDKAGDTPLHIAARIVDRDRSTIMSQILAAGADIDARDKRGDTAFTIVAVSPGNYNLEHAKTLLEAGADPNVKNKVGNTAMHAVVWNGNYGLMKMMHGYNVDWNLKNDDGRSPMLDALYSKRQPNPNIFGAAAHFGADIYTTNEFGENVLHVAIENEHLDLVDNFLRQRNAFRNMAKEKDIFGMTPLDLADDIGVLDGTMTYVRLKAATLLDDLVPLQ